MKKSTLFLIVIIIIVLIAGVLWKTKSGNVLENSSAPADIAARLSADRTTDISKDLDSVNVGNVEDDFTAVKADINSL